mgnify:CR=1 FL=1
MGSFSMPAAGSSFDSTIEESSSRNFGSILADGSCRTAGEARSADIIGTSVSDTNADTTVKEFEQSRENVREAWADVKASADNLGNERFDAVENAWDDVAKWIFYLYDHGRLAEVEGDAPQQAQRGFHRRRIFAVDDQDART